MSMRKIRGALTQTQAQDLTTQPYFCYDLLTKEIICEDSAVLSADLDRASAMKDSVPLY